MKYAISRLNDFHLNETWTASWGHRFQQVSPGVMRSALEELRVGHVRICQKYLDQRVVQEGGLNRGRICFALPGGPLDTVALQGRPLQSDSIFVLRDGADFILHRPKNMHLVAVTIDQERFDDMMEEAPWGRQARDMLTQTVVPLGARELSVFRGEMTSMFDVPSLRLDESKSPERAAELAVFAALSKLFDAPGRKHARRVASTSANFIVEESHRYLLANTKTPLTVEDICRRFRTSRRTVQNSFQKVAQTTPIDYLRSIRLNGARQQLLFTPADELSIADVAAQWGFLHLGHFAANYRSLFGELPSDTIRAVKPEIELTASVFSYH